MDILIAVLTGGVAAAVIKLIEAVALWRLNRKAKQSDDGKAGEAARQAQRDSELDDVSKTVQVLQTAQRVILHDRIKYLGRSHIKTGAISFDDREDLVDMHRIYHSELDGNGHLDQLMAEVMRLPLKG